MGRNRSRMDSRIGPSLPWEKDKECQKFVHVEHPTGATLEVIAEAMGLTRERVRQIEKESLNKLKTRYPPDILERVFGY